MTNNEYLAIDLSTHTAHIAWARYSFSCSTVEDYVSKTIEPKRGKLLHKSTQKPFATHNETLVGDIEIIRKSIQGAYTRLRGIVVNLGPGSFTGLRVALSFAKGLQAGLKFGIQQGISTDTQCAIIGIGAMEYLASINAEANPVFCILDARSNKLYCQFFEDNIASSVIEDLTKEALLAKVKQYQQNHKHIYFTGRDEAMVVDTVDYVANNCATASGLRIAPIDNVDHGLALITLGIQKHKEKKNIVDIDSEPNYVRAEI